MRYIYCYTNLVNNKKYVGQTNDIARRKAEHKKASSIRTAKEGSFHHALGEYGVENFKFEILFEGDVSREEINKLEKEYIAWAESQGEVYNIKIGGSADAPCNQYTLEVISEAKELIKKGVRYTDITKAHELSPAFLSGLNWGYSHKVEGEEYPLNKHFFLEADTIYPKMVQLLLNPKYRFKDIAEELGCSYSTVKSFNSGRLQRGKYWKEDYPIRVRYFCDRAKWEEALHLLATTSIPSRIIGREMVHVSDAIMTRLNSGELLKKDYLEYPIR